MKTQKVKRRLKKKLLLSRTILKQTALHEEIILLPENC
jgi:hypothetical protein